MKLKQIYIGDAVRGLARRIAVLDISPKELKEMKGIKFETARDDLDYMLVALVATEDGQQFGLVNRYRGPFPERTSVYGNEQSNCIEADVEKFLNAIEIPREYVLWMVGRETDGEKWP